MKLTFPATARNREPLVTQLRDLFAPPCARVLEVASGSGEHAAYFAEALPWLVWQPTDVETAHLESIDAWAAGQPRILRALRYDAETEPLPAGPWDGIFCANLVHIAPWSVAEGLFRAAVEGLAPGALLVTYGPYTIDGKHTSASNATFDAGLMARDPRWGVRDVAALAALRVELDHLRTIPMPANNFTLVFRRRRSAP
ncbi:MAG: DUF938 domain-containing protein [Myxococcales bacterium]|nr:DUF938 domain-containing protein [Myxococcales bacterium]